MKVVDKILDIPEPKEEKCPYCNEGIMLKDTIAWWRCSKCSRTATLVDLLCRKMVLTRPNKN